jgi:hypothetical protein
LLWRASERYFENQGSDLHGGTGKPDIIDKISVAPLVHWYVVLLRKTLLLCEPFGMGFAVTDFVSCFST